MLLLTGSLIATVAGAFLYRWLHDRSGAVRLFDGFMFLGVTALVAWQVIHHAWASHGLLPIVVLVLGGRYAGRH